MIIRRDLLWTGDLPLIPRSRTKDETSHLFSIQLTRAIDTDRVDSIDEVPEGKSPGCHDDRDDRNRLTTLDSMYHRAVSFVRLLCKDKFEALDHRVSSDRCCEVFTSSFSDLNNIYIIIKSRKQREDHRPHRWSGQWMPDFADWNGFVCSETMTKTQQGWTVTHFSPPSLVLYMSR